ncbi:MAG: hypothetical protein KDK39_18160, partial [Leptospiraceae bacterium]|nr:hypothetical protein [Leptospiraceae bacterium]
MKYGKIRGESVPACLVELRQKFGEDVIILNTNQVREGGLFGTDFLSHPMYEVQYSVPEKRIRSTPVAAHNPLADPEQPRSSAAAKKQATHRERPAASVKSRAGQALVNDPGALIETLAESITDPAEFKALNRMLSDQDPFGDDEQDKQRTSPHDTDIQNGNVSNRDSESHIQPESVESGGTHAESVSRPALDEPMFSRMQDHWMLQGLDLDDRARRHFERIQQLLLRAQLSPEFTSAFLRSLDHHLSREQKQDYHR